MESTNWFMNFIRWFSGGIKDAPYEVVLAVITVLAGVLKMYGGVIGKKSPYITENKLIELTIQLTDHFDNRLAEMSDKLDHNIKKNTAALSETHNILNDHILKEDETLEKLNKATDLIASRQDRRKRNISKEHNKRTGDEEHF